MQGENSAVLRLLQSITGNIIIILLNYQPTASTNPRILMKFGWRQWLLAVVCVCAHTRACKCVVCVSVLCVST